MSATLKDKVDAVRRALAERGLVDNRVALADENDIEQQALAGARAFASTSEDRLAKRAVVAVEGDRRRDAVVIYTTRAYAQTDQKKMADVFDPELPIIFRALDIGPQGPGSVPLSDLPMKPVLKGGRITCGTSISVANDRAAGTLGALVRDGEGTLFGLSCGHVVAACGYLRSGMPIMAPGIQDVVQNWPDPRVIGHFSHALPLVPGDPKTIGVRPNLDAALFKIVRETAVSSSQSGHYDTPTEIHDLDAETDEGVLEVAKVGRTTGHTVGTVESEFTNPIEIDFKFTCYPELGVPKKFEASVYVDNLWRVSSSGEPFAAPGDSGALVVTNSIAGAERRAVGLVVAGTRDRSAIILPIRPILDSFGVSLVAGLRA